MMTRYLDPGDGALRRGRGDAVVDQKRQLGAQGGLSKPNLLGIVFKLHAVRRDVFFCMHWYSIGQKQCT